MTFDLFQTDWRELWAGATDSEPVGAVFTKPEIVNLILDLAGYVAGDRRLVTLRLLEPSCGDGAFLIEVVRRLLESETWVDSGNIDWAEPAFDDCIRASDISTQSVERARTLVDALLRNANCPAARASELSAKWIVHSDFLLESWPGRFDFVVGNPPYVRIEELPKPVLARYRASFASLSDRADIYVAFFERGLELLSEAGTLAFICANRFAKNKYGEPLRRLIAERHHVRFYLNLEHTSPFESDVSAYPAIFVIDQKRGAKTRARTLEILAAEELDGLRPDSPAFRGAWSVFEQWYGRGEPWVSTDSSERTYLSKLASRLPTIEDSAPGTKIGIGVATGSDKTFVLPGKRSDVEGSVQLPLLMAADVRNGELKWSGHYLLNPFAAVDDGSLVDLKEFPGFAAYLEANGEALRERHVAKSRPHAWYRTIDRIWPELQRRPKLVMPDIQTRIVVGYDPGEFYPHHNLYWITSDSWDLLALQTLLRSNLVVSQVRAFSVQMRGGAIRFQAQTLRKVRIPSLASIPCVLIERLRELSASSDQVLIDAISAEAFALGDEAETPLPSVA